MILSESQRSFLRAQRFGHLATVDPRGQPDVAVAEYQLSDEHLVIGTLVGLPDLAESLPFRNAARSGRVALAVEEQRAAGPRGITLHGRAAADEHHVPPLIILEPDWVRTWGFPEESV